MTSMEYLEPLNPIPIRRDMDELHYLYLKSSKVATEILNYCC